MRKRHRSTISYDGLGRGTWALVALVITAGCGPTIQLEDDTTTGSSDSTSTSTTSPPVTTTTLPPVTTTTSPPGTTTTSPPNDTTGGPDDGFVFLGGHDGGSVGLECDMFLQDCPPGEKCMPWANDGSGAWNATRCSPVVDDPNTVGEPCTVEGSGTSGIDSCDYGAMCWDVDPETNEGTCIALCTGDAGNPMCDEGSLCTIANDGVLILCLPTCDPLLQDCPEGDACMPWGSDGFVCIPHVVEGAGGPGQSCEFINACEAGLACVAAEFVPDCVAAGCCSPFCNLTDPMPPCLPGQECEPWFEEAPPGYEDVGVCALPP